MITIDALTPLHRRLRPVRIEHASRRHQPLRPGRREQFTRLVEAIRRSVHSGPIRIGDEPL
jgi:hypothetical protein